MKEWYASGLKTRKKLRKDGGIILDFKSMVKDENIWISNEGMNNVPVVIQKEYFFIKVRLLMFLCMIQMKRFFTR